MSVVHRVLAIDDDASVRVLLESLLTLEGYAVDTAADGPAGLRQLAADPPDCVVLDVMMPGMDGYSVLAEIRSRQRGRHVPVIMLTAADDDRNAWRAWQGGVDCFLAKPFEIAELLRQVRHLCTHPAPEVAHTSA
ncbi:MAG: pleD [Frankiales bacterium]|nr:pleD [Frankiales bacterium]